MDIHLQKCLEYRERAIRFYRLGLEAQGSESLVVFIDTLTKVLPRIPELASPATNQVLEAILQAQARKDFLFMADLLEYEIPLHLQSL